MIDISDDVIVVLTGVIFILSALYDNYTGHMHSRFFDIDKNVNKEQFKHWLSARYVLGVIAICIGIIRIIETVN
jgi:hypothetical protein